MCLQKRAYKTTDHRYTGLYGDHCLDSRYGNFNLCFPRVAPHLDFAVLDTEKRGRNLDGVTMLEIDQAARWLPRMEQQWECGDIPHSIDIEAWISHILAQSMFEDVIDLPNLNFEAVHF